MMDFLNAITPVLDVLGSVPITTDNLHDAEQAAAQAVELVHTDEIHAGENLHGADEHGGEGIGAIWNEAWSVISDPAHAIAEVFYNIAVDLVIIPIVVLLYKKIREPKLRAAIHKEIDDEHGITHNDCNGGPKDRTHKDQASASSMELSQDDLNSMSS